MNDQIIPFSFQNKQVRAVIIDDETFLVGKDSALAIGYTVNSFRNALRDHVKPKYKRECQINTPSGSQIMTVISEPGIYQLAGQSKLPSAEPFQDWVYEQVLPSINHQGIYATEQTWDKLINNPDAIIKLAQNWKKATVERDQAQAALQVEHDQRLEVEDELSVAQPKADYTDTVLSSKGAMSITVIAKEYGMSAVKMNKVLHNMGVQFETNGVWVLYAKYADKGYTKIDTVPITHNDGRGDFKPHMKWTQKGRKFLYDFLKERGILPVAEQQELGMEAM